MESIKLCARNGAVVRQASELGAIAHAVGPDLLVGWRAPRDIVASAPCACRAGCSIRPPWHQSDDLCMDIAPVSGRCHTLRHGNIRAPQTPPPIIMPARRQRARNFRP